MWFLGDVMPKSEALMGPSSPAARIEITLGSAD